MFDEQRRLQNSKGAYMEIIYTDDHAEIYENGNKLSRQDSIKMIEEVMIHADPFTEKVLFRTLLTLQKEKERLS